MEFQSTNFNAAKIELAALDQTSDAASGLEAHLGGAVVADYDAQIRSFTAELVATNAEKAAVQTDKLALTQLMGGLTELTAANGYVYTDANHVEQKFSGKAYLMGMEDLNKLTSLATELGVDLSAVSVNGDKRAVPENLIQAVKDGLDAKLSDLNSTSELKLIRYQSLMDARKQSMLMLSNMLSSDNQTRMAVIQNMKG